ncbi:PEP/pyruvate-binding domain-containing protein [Thermodesulfobacteriota bacterium B35]
MLLNTLFRHWSYRLFAPGTMLRQTYEAFKRLLVFDGQCHDLMAEFEVLYHDGRREDFAAIRDRYDRFARAVSGMIDALEQLSPTEAEPLREYFVKFDFYVRFLLAPPEQFIIPPFVVDLTLLPEPELAGNKAHNLARLRHELGAPVPAGFSITTTAFFDLIEENGLRAPIDELLAAIDIEQPRSLARISEQLVAMVRGAVIPRRVRERILAAWDRMEEQCGGPVRAAVRSSAVSEDSEHSFAGQYHTVLGADRESILESYLEVVASKYTPEALLYRITLGLADEEAPIAVLVLAMVEAAVSGIVYTSEPVAGQDRLVIHCVHGLGEALVGGAASPDIFFLDRQRLEVIGRRQGREQVPSEGAKARQQAPAEPGRLAITDARARELAAWGIRIETLFGTPQDIEWAIDTREHLFLLQARPLRSEVADQETDAPVPTPEPLLATGSRAAGGVACGRVFLSEGRDLREIPEGSVLVIRNTPPSLVRVMTRLAAVVAERGSSAGHFATVCREFGVPLIVDAADATRILHHGDLVTVDAGRVAVYPGRVEGLVRQRATEENRRELPYFRKLGAILSFITPLNLLDPRSPEFRPVSCRSLHDIVRYVHERAVQAMFAIGDRSHGGPARRLESELPLEVYLLDVGGGIRNHGGQGPVSLEQVCSVPFLALWRGLSHPDVDWQNHAHFDWKSFDDVALAGGVATRKGGDYASYAVIGSDYLNLNMRFGYHFTLVDALCGGDARANYCQFRFAGGGGDYTGRSRRIDFLRIILTRLGFEVDVRADLLDARVADIDCADLCHMLDMLGRLLGTTKLMDMVLREGVDVRACVEEFFAGRYSFSSLDGRAGGGE